MESMNCETATAFLIDKITEAMDIVAPIETKELKGNTINTWKTKAIKICLNKQRSLYCAYKNSNSTSAKERYKKYKKNLRQGY